MPVNHPCHFLTSEATNTGTATLYIYFKQGTDPDMAAVNVQNRVSKATGLLPAEVNQIGVSTIKRQNSILEVVSIYSPDGSCDDAFLSNYMRINVQPEILRISGVGEVVVFGATYSKNYSQNITAKFVRKLDTSLALIILA